jgi:hypothetical protein
MKRIAPVVLSLGILMSALPSYAETALPEPPMPASGQPVPRMAPNAVQFALQNGMQVVVIP